jgi:hypothetical protein
LGRVPAYFAQEYTATLNSALFTSGLALSTLSSTGVKGLTGPIKFAYASTDPVQYIPGLFVPWEQRLLYTPVPSYTLINNVIVLLAGNADLGEAYTNFDSMVVSYTPNPAAIEDNETTLTGWPDDALDVFATMLAAFYLRRMVGSPDWQIAREDADFFYAQAREAREDFLTRISRGITQQQSYYIVDALP